MNRGSKPKLAANEVVEITNPSAVSAGLDNTKYGVEVPPTLGSRLSGLLRAALGLAVVGAMLGVAVYAALAATVTIVASTDGTKSVVMRGTYPVGQVPEGAVVLVSNKAAATNTIEKLSEGFLGTSAGSVVVVVAGPGAAVRNDTDGQIIANGEPSGWFAPLDARDLDREYVALCIRGACPKGEAVLVGERAVVGKVKGDIAGLTSLTPTPLPMSDSKPAIETE